MRLLSWIYELLFPPKCILCRKVLSVQEMDLCHQCRTDQQLFPYGRGNPAPNSISHAHFLDSLTAVWYYEGDVRTSIHRFKFGRHPDMAEPFGRLMAIRLLEQQYEDIDLVTWAPVFIFRKLVRGFDQSQLLAQAIGRELNLNTLCLIRKIRNTPAQSGMPDASGRKANALGAYRVIHPADVQGKRILLVDDVHTTGSTTEECAKILKLAGAKEVHCAVIAAAHK